MRVMSPARSGLANSVSRVICRPATWESKRSVQLIASNRWAGVSSAALISVSADNVIGPGSDVTRAGQLAAETVVWVIAAPFPLARSPVRIIAEELGQAQGSGATVVSIDGWRPAELRPGTVRWNTHAGTAEPDTAGRDAAGRDAAGRDAAGRDAAGRDAAGRDAAGRDAAGRDRRSVAGGNRH